MAIIVGTILVLAVTAIVWITIAVTSSKNKKSNASGGFDIDFDF